MNMGNELSNLDDEETAAALAAVAEIRSNREAAAMAAERKSEILYALEPFYDGPGYETFVATQNSDLTEGRGGRVPRGQFLFREDAEKAQYVLEGPGGSTNGGEIWTQTVWGSFEEWLAGDKAAVDKDRLDEVRAGTADLG